MVALVLAESALVVGMVLTILVALAVAVIFVNYGMLWFQAYMSGADVRLMSLIGMTFRHVKPSLIVTAKIMARQSGLSAFAHNGVELRARARVTVRTNLDQVIGGATEETIIARVGQGIISAIGSSKTHMEVMEMPDRISKAVLARGLDTNTAFEIVSIDIADIEVGENIGARLQGEQAEADTRMARALAEARRANAIATQQEMKAQVTNNRALLIIAEAKIPLALAGAFRAGHYRAAAAKTIKDRRRNPQNMKSAADAFAGPQSPRENRAMPNNPLPKVKQVPKRTSNEDQKNLTDHHDPTDSFEIDIGGES